MMRKECLRSFLFCKSKHRNANFAQCLHVPIFPHNRAILKSGKITLHDIIIITDTLRHYNGKGSWLPLLNYVWRPACCYNYENVRNLPI